jgi:NADPH2:quinone reductase
VKNVRLQFFIVYNLSEPDRAAGLAGVTALLDAGRLQHNVAACLPLARIAEAHELVEGGQARGNVVIGIA